VVGIGVGKPWAVSDHNRCEQQQSLAATSRRGTCVPDMHNMKAAKGKQVHDSF